MDVPVGMTVTFALMNQSDLPTEANLIVHAIFTALLLISAGIFSAAEIAFFAVKPQMLEDMAPSKAKERLKNILDKPKTLLSTFIILNNTLTIAAIVFAEPLLDLLPLHAYPTWLIYTIYIAIIAFFLLAFVELIPKFIANKNVRKISLSMSGILSFFMKLCRPLSAPMLSFGNYVDKKFQKKDYPISVEELSHALEITGISKQDKDSGKLLESIVKFGSVEVSSIMTPRIDVFLLDKDLQFDEVLAKIIENGYSRIPVYDDNTDNIVGLLYAKDLIPYINQSEDFDWNALLRKPYFVPENKKIDDLLKEFQQKKMHLAVVVDEYGGTCGIVTLEDILEEIVGEINDEFDVEVNQQIQISENEFILSAKMHLKDVVSELRLPQDTFAEWEDNVDTLGGVIFETLNTLPERGQEIEVKNLKIKILSTDNRKIHKVKITLLSPENHAK